MATSIGSSGGEAVVVDLVADGPHALVIGVTGAGKSELLTTWVAGMCRGRTAREVSFLLVDFKGGRTFDALAGLPHVAGVLTDLDDAEATFASEVKRLFEKSVRALDGDLQQHIDLIADPDDPKDLYSLVKAPVPVG